MMCGGTLFMTQNNCCLSHPYLMVTAEQITYLWFIRGEIPSGLISHAGRYGGPICTGICKAGGAGAYRPGLCRRPPPFCACPSLTHTTPVTRYSQAALCDITVSCQRHAKKTSKGASRAGQGVQARVPVDMAKSAERLEVPLWLEQVRRSLLSQ